jgi:hypothetical protein
MKVAALAGLFVLGLVLALVLTRESGPPALVIGEFEDDYGASYSITQDIWRHEESRYDIARWVPDEGYAIARNAAENVGQAGLWTRIDWMPLPDMAPWEWAFCLTAWDARTEEEAIAEPSADRSDPRAGCGGFPFSRMKRVDSALSADTTISSVAWLSGTWTSVPDGAPTEERWTVGAGGAMLGTSQTVADDRMVAFEYLRIVERDGGLVYIAQPGGGAPTEFVLTSIDVNQVVFENPAHDYPQRISYTLGTDGVLRAEISDTAGLSPRKIRFVKAAGGGGPPAGR